MRAAARRHLDASTTDFLRRRVQERASVRRPMRGCACGHTKRSIVPGTMRAAFFEGYRTITVRDAEVPDPKPDEVRLKVKYCGICGSDMSLYKTGALAGPDVILGHEVSGTVDLDPSGRWAPGARVTLGTSAGWVRSACSPCAACSPPDAGSSEPIPGRTGGSWPWISGACRR